MRILFAGSPSVALPTLGAMIKDGHNIVGVLTQPAKPVGRAGVITPTEVARFATEHQLPVFTPATPQELDQVLALSQPDIAIVLAYGRILPPAALAAIPLGWWNIHFSLLPRWRGAAPVQHALLAGDQTTGISLFRIVPELDAGPVFELIEHPIAPHETSGSLLEKLSQLAPALVQRLLGAAKNGHPPVTEQVGESSVAPKFGQDAGVLALSGSAAEVYRHFRAVTPEPGATLRRSDNQAVVKILRCWEHRDASRLDPGELLVASGELLLGTASTAVVLDQVQPAGKRAMPGVDWFRGLPTGVELHGA
jgi:methionyl-tRNA formyltransferase